ncbi:MAG TPA: thioredoxin domain-containing protein [Bryobacteraceae bacterium]|nr:thioredoxin domain-containing protein [Bryobacteraceae bacterium]
MKQFALLMFSAALLTGQDHEIEGNRASTVRVIVYEDLQCPDCAVFRKMMDTALLPKYKDKVAFEHREFPLPKHKYARPAAIGARYFASVKPELGVAFRQFLYADPMSITPENLSSKIAEFAKKHGADPAAAVAALNDKKLAQAVEEDYQEGVARGVAKTPTVFVNGEPFVERFTVEDISKAIDAALAAAPK